MKRTPGHEYFLFDTVFNIVEIGIYTLSFLGPLFLLWNARGLDFPWLVLLGVVLWPVTGILFGALLVVLARITVWKWPRESWGIRRKRQRNAITPAWTCPSWKQMH